MFNTKRVFGSVCALCNKLKYTILKHTKKTKLLLYYYGKMCVGFYFMVLKHKNVLSSKKTWSLNQLHTSDQIEYEG